MLMEDRAARSAGTRRRILAAARELVRTGAEPPTMGAVAARAGVARLTVYQHFHSHGGLLEAVVASARPAGEPAGEAPSLRMAIESACHRWAADPILFRRLPSTAASDPDAARDLASRLAAEDRLRPGCSLREAEDVIALVTSFPAFDRLHHDGRRSPAAVAEILGRMAASVLASGYSPTNSEPSA